MNNLKEKFYNAYTKVRTTLSDKIATKVLAPLSNRNAWGETEGDAAKGSLNLIVVVVLVVFTVAIVTLVVVYLNKGTLSLKDALDKLFGIVPTVTP